MDGLITEISEDYEPELRETEAPPQIVEIDDRDGIRFNARFTGERRIRQALYDRILAARAHLPNGLTFMIYEAYRPVSRQRALWREVYDRLRAEHPERGEPEVKAMTRAWVADPDGVGSGHLFAAAVDITLCDMASAEPLDMGCGMQEFDDRTATWSDKISEEHRANRRLMVEALAQEGVLNYPPEWWHFSYGDRIWAILQRRSDTLFSPLGEDV